MAVPAMITILARYGIKFVNARLGKRSSSGSFVMERGTRGQNSDGAAASVESAHVRTRSTPRVLA